MMLRGDQFVAYPDRRPAERHYIEVTRMARDGSWADIIVRTWAVEWRKRQPLAGGAFAFEHAAHVVTAADLAEQEADHMRKYERR